MVITPIASVMRVQFFIDNPDEIDKIDVVS